MVDSLSPQKDNPALISLQAIEQSISRGTIAYLALGDRHSLTQVGDTGRIWYSGSPEPTAYDEVRPGKALVVEIDDKGPNVRERQVGTWHFIERDRLEASTVEDLASLRSWIGELPDKDRTILKLRLVGTPTLTIHAQLQTELEEADELLAALG